MTKYFAISDWEATCSDNGWNKSNRMEIIEFASIITDINFNVKKEFDMFVQPILNPQLSDYCKNLTTIQQTDIDKASTFAIILSKFKECMRKISTVNDDFLFCSWGRYDEKQLRSDCELHNVKYPFNDMHCNLKEVVAKKLKIGKKHKGMESMLKYLGLSLDGTHHRGIDDCRNILKICRKAQLCVGDML